MLAHRLKVVAIAAIATACAATPPESSARIEPTACPSHEAGGEVQCYTVHVPESPTRRDSRRIGLRVMVLRALSAERSPDPLFVLAGGPGQAATEGTFFPEFFAPVRQTRDIVLLDQRGTGGSNPLALAPSEAEFLIEPEMNIPPAWGRLALARLERQADLGQYTTARAVDDIEIVRHALGYRRLNLYGTSYGTRVAQYYIKRHRDRVRSAVLKGVVPPEANVVLSYGRNPQQALEQLFALCAADVSCAAEYPDLRADLDTVLARLAASPVTVSLAHPTTGAPMPFLITRGSFAFGVRSQLMSAAGFARLPAMIAQAAAGDFSLWAPFLLQVRQSYASSLYGGMAFSVIASEDVPRLTDALIDADAQGAMIGDVLARGFADLADFWPRGSAPADLFAPLRSDASILLISGALDPATPQEGPEAMLAGLPNARHVVFAGGAHSASNFTGLDQIIAEFVREGSVADLDLRAAENNRPLPFAP